MWLHGLSFFCFVALFSPAPAGLVVKVGKWESKKQPDRRYPVIGPRMRGHEPRTAAPALPPYQLPMFRHVKAPIVDMELFRPAMGLGPLPSAVKSLLLPPQDSWLGYPTAPVSNPSGVEVWCGNGTISVRVNRRMLGFWCRPSMLFLENCKAYRFNRDYIYFHNFLDECGIRPRIVDGQLVYTSILRYVPERQGAVIRAVPLSLSIHCVYNRFHYTYKVGYVPHLKSFAFTKTISTERYFSLVPCNEHWERLGSTESYMLGAPMNFEASTTRLSRMDRVSVTTCHITVSKDPYSVPRMDVIENFGCMVDSRRFGSRSKFHSYTAGVLRFSIDAFVFPGISSQYLYLHCEMTEGDYSATPTAKSCTFNSKMQRWEELFGSVSVCTCCDSQCGPNRIHAGHSSLYPSPRSLITSDPWSVAMTKGAGGAQQVDRGEADVGQEAKGAGPVTEPIDYGEEESEAGSRETKQGPRDPVQVRASWGRGRGQGSEGRSKVGAQEELLRAEGEPALWREDDQGPDLDQEEAEEDGGLQEEVGAEDGPSSRTVAGKVLESLAI
ncbi:hypothetical protein COCON_G00002540 [Conger conger]|uniref:ZP domain-containing protein n=1 Tax=Conger conger TaxID=82655 RepID=A0A9Q1I883_CONCO|nr:hypothetical protein COCON_G00002540 [Conger conger]